MSYDVLYAWDAPLGRGDGAVGNPHRAPMGDVKLSPAKDITAIGASLTLPAISVRLRKGGWCSWKPHRSGGDHLSNTTCLTQCVLQACQLMQHSMMVLDMTNNYSTS